MILTTTRILTRSYSTKPAIALLSKLRQETQAPLSKAKEALVHTENNFEKALEWLKEEMQRAGLNKAEKVASRSTTEGLVSIAISNAGKFNAIASIIELNCETDFVSRNDNFKDLATRIASTARMLPLLTNEDNVKSQSKSILSQIKVQDFTSWPLLPESSSSTRPADELQPQLAIADAIVNSIGRLGENISLRRVCTAMPPLSRQDIVLNGYVHGGSSSGFVSTGRLGAIVALQVTGPSALLQSEHCSSNLEKLSKGVARHIAGFDPLVISDSLNGRVPPSSDDQITPDRILLNQDYITGGGKISDVLENFNKMYGVKVEIIEFTRWQTGEQM